jgi:hypothetical protein
VTRACIGDSLRESPADLATGLYQRQTNAREPEGAQALRACSAGIATTDADGRAQTPSLRAGRYRAPSDAKIDNKRVVWNQPVDENGAGATLTLDQRNSMPVERSARASGLPRAATRRNTPARRLRSPDHSCRRSGFAGAGAATLANRTNIREIRAPRG